MRIGFDAKRLYSNFTGLGNYSRTLVKQLGELYPGEAYFLYTTNFKKNPETDYFRNLPSIYQTHVSNTFLKPLWRSYTIVKQLKKDGIDLYHGLSNEIPFSLRKYNVKSVVTVHDLIFKIYPETYPFFDRKIYDLKFRYSCQNADRIIAISENTKKDIIRYYDIDPEKIEVIYQSCNPLFFKTVKKETAIKVLQQHKLPAEYLLYVGSITQRKNLKQIIKAYSYLKPTNKIPLVVVGNGKSYKQEVLQLIKKNKLENTVLWISNMEDNHQLHALYQEAMALVYPSLYEGFGLPVAEALLSRTPVITSNVSSLPEAGGPDSCYVNPEDAEAFANAITNVLEDSECRATMQEKGYQYAMRNFSATQVTRQLMDCYGRVLGG